MFTGLVTNWFWFFVGQTGYQRQRHSGRQSQRQSVNTTASNNDKMKELELLRSRLFELEAEMSNRNEPEPQSRGLNVSLDSEGQNHYRIRQGWNINFILYFGSTTFSNNLDKTIVLVAIIIITKPTSCDRTTSKRVRSWLTWTGRWTGPPCSCREWSSCSWRCLWIKKY